MNADDYKVDVPTGTKGEWTVKRIEVPEKGLYALSYGARAPKPGRYTSLIRKGAFDPMMSDTRAEVWDHLEVIHKLEAAEPGSRVLIHGLGIGMILQVALRNENIEHVDVVEIEQDVIDLVAPHYLTRFGSERLTVHHDDAFKKQWPKNSHWDIVWHDIWPSLCTDDLEEHATLNRKFAKRATWQGCWGHDFLLDARRRDMAWQYGI